MELTKSFQKPADSKSSLIVIAGPTGAGKSALALALAWTFQGALINYDSVQVYRGLDIGSAKTPVAQRGEVPHYLLDVVSPQEELTAGTYSNLARNCLEAVTASGKLPIFAGGTGFYLRSLIQGLSPAPGRNPELRRRLTDLVSRRPAALHRFLRRADPAAALRIHPNDHPKLMRAVELSAAVPPSPRVPLAGYRILQIGLNPARPDLYQRLDRRSEAMFQGGLLDETNALLAAGVSGETRALQSLGYKQAVAVLAGRLAQADALKELQTKTRQYAKRQMTWFRREPDMHWLDGFGDSMEIQESAKVMVDAFLQNRLVKE